MFHVKQDRRNNIKMYREKKLTKKEYLSFLNSLPQLKKNRTLFIYFKKRYETYQYIIEGMYMNEKELI